nr:hypothetical protein Q903MT_gene1155 [Picea sitchensis]
MRLLTVVVNLEEWEWHKRGCSKDIECWLIDSPITRLLASRRLTRNVPVVLRAKIMVLLACMYRSFQMVYWHI